MSNGFDIAKFNQNNPPPRNPNRPPIPKKEKKLSTVNVDANGIATIDGNLEADLPPPGLSARREAANEDEEREKIYVDSDEHRVVDEFIEILGTKENIYQKANMLVMVFSKPNDDPEELDYPNKLNQLTGTPRIGEIKAAKLRTLMSRYAEWITYVKASDRKDEYDEKPIHPPDWAVTQVLADGVWKGVPEVSAIVECPIIRSDGSIVDKPGYDHKTGVVYWPNAHFDPVPEIVSKEDAEEAVFEIADLVDEFPFAPIAGNRSTSKAAWLAALLTPFARYAIPGPCPLFLFDANLAGSGKSLLCDTIALITTGRNMSRTTYPSNDEEMRKRITSIALSGDQFMLLDNVATQFGGASLDAVLTSITWKDRILGKSEMSRELPIYTIWYATGNNIFLKGDIQRRIIPCTLDCDDEKPQDREFKYDDLPRHLLENRAKYVRLCLTILRGFIQAGKPRGCRSSLGSYESWSDIIRSAVIWCTGEDCVSAQDEYREMHDSSVEVKASLIRGLSEMPMARKPSGITVAAILSTISDLESMNSKQFMTLRDALHEISGSTDLPSTKQLGNKLKSINNHVVGGLKLIHCNQKAGYSKTWRVIDLREDEPETNSDPVIDPEEARLFDDDPA